MSLKNKDNQFESDLSKDNEGIKQNQNTLIQAPTAENEIPWEWKWWDNPMYKKIFKAEESVVEILQNPRYLNPEGMIQKDKLIEIIDSLFKFGKVQANAIIESVHKEGYIIEHQDGFLELDKDAVGDDY